VQHRYSIPGTARSWETAARCGRLQRQRMKREEVAEELNSSSVGAARSTHSVTGGRDRATRARPALTILVTPSWCA
jgi:hypothetical protein